MKVNRAAAVKLFTEIGWNSASKKISDDEWTQDKLRAVPKNVEDVEFEDSEAKELASAICKALENDEDVEFELEGDVESVSEKPAKAKKGAKAETKPAKGKKGAEKSAKGENKEKKSEVAKDKWGLKVGSQGSLAMAVLNKKKAKPMSEIVSEAKLPSTCYDFMKRMITGGLVEKTDDGFRLK